MSKALSLKDLYDLMGANAKVSPRTAEKVWTTFLNLLVSEIRYNGKISIDNFGRFETKIEGGKDEYVTNELGIVEKRYIPRITSLKFKPSVNLLDEINNDKPVEKMDKVSDDTLFDYDNYILEVDKNTEKTISDAIDIALHRKEIRRKKEIKRENNKNKRKAPTCFKGYPIKCITNNRVYSSMSECGKDLNLRVNNIKKALENGKLLYGYKLVRLTDEEYKEEMELREHGLQ